MRRAGLLRLVLAAAVLAAGVTLVEEWRTEAAKQRIFGLDGKYIIRDPPSSETADIYRIVDGPTKVWSVADGMKPFLAITGAAPAAPETQIRTILPRYDIVATFGDHGAKTYEYVRAQVKDGKEAWVLALPFVGTDGQECLGSLQATGDGSSVYCRSPRFVDVWTEDGKRVRVDRASGEVQGGVR